MEVVGGRSVIIGATPSSLVYFSSQSLFSQNYFLENIKIIYFRKIILSSNSIGINKWLDESFSPGDINSNLMMGHFTRIERRWGTLLRTSLLLNRMVSYSNFGKYRKHGSNKKTSPPHKKVFFVTKENNKKKILTINSF